MQTAPTADPTAARLDAASQRQTWPVVRRWVMVALTLVLLGAVPVLASFGSHEGKLLDGLRDGTVTEVAVGEPRLGPGGGRDRTVRVSWRGRVLQHHAEVAVGKDERSTSATRDELLEQWQDVQPGLTVTAGESGATGGSFGPSARGVEVPSWMAVAWLVTLLGSVVRLVTGPQPHVFRRWGWFWLLWCVPVVGALNFWVAGDRPGVPAPGGTGGRDPRFGGVLGFLGASGLAFVLALLTALL